MISRLSTFAASFAILATASLAVAANAQYTSAAPAAVAAKTVRVVELPRVVIVAKRLTAETR